MTADAHSSEELLREIADGDLSSVGGLSPSRMRGKRGGLIEPESRQLVEVAALAAVDAPMEAWRAHFGARGALIDLDKVSLGQAAVDLGSLLSLLRYKRLVGRLTAADERARVASLLAGYAGRRSLPSLHRRRDQIFSE